MFVTAAKWALSIILIVGAMFAIIVGVIARLHNADPHHDMVGYIAGVPLLLAASLGCLHLVRRPSAK